MNFFSILTKETKAIAIRKATGIVQRLAKEDPEYDFSKMLSRVYLGAYLDGYVDGAASTKTEQTEQTNKDS